MLFFLPGASRLPFGRNVAKAKHFRPFRGCTFPLDKNYNISGGGACTGTYEYVAGMIAYFRFPSVLI